MSRLDSTMFSPILSKGTSVMAPVPSPLPCVMFLATVTTWHVLSPVGPKSFELILRRSPSQNPGIAATGYAALFEFRELRIILLKNKLSDVAFLDRVEDFPALPSQIKRCRSGLTSVGFIRLRLSELPE